MKKITLTILIQIFILWGIIAQNVVITQFPQNYHFFPRDVASNKGSFTVSGSVKSTFIADTFRLLLLRETEPIFSAVSAVKFTDGVFNFSYKLDIKAELANYSVVLTLQNAGKVVYTKKAEKIVSGDVIAINGQSNNIGMHDPVDYDPFLRSFTYNFNGWNEIQYSFAGKWSGRIAKSIVDNQKIPVAVFNESLGGERAVFYLKNNNDSSNYKALYNRLKLAGVEKNVRALFWWQGESDGWETPIDTYKSQFKQLYSDWQKDYFNVPVFYYQIRFNSCRHVVPGIMEVQRQIKNELPNAEVMSVNAAIQYDSCHFYYKNGYDSLGNRMYRLMASKLYKGSSVNVRPPDVDAAYFSNMNEITIKMKHLTGSLRQIGSPWNDFEINGVNIPITNGRVEDDKIILNFSTTSDTSILKKITGISYKSHVTKNEDWIVNPLGVGILSFYNVPISNNIASSKDKNLGDSGFSVYPTLTHDKLYFAFNNKTTAESTITIISIEGKIVLQKKVGKAETSGEIDIQQLPKGFYIARNTEGGKAIKFLKVN